MSFRLNARLSDVQPGLVMVSDEEIRAQTLVWTAGTAPNPLLKSQPFERDKRGAVKVDPTLAVPGHSGHQFQRYPRPGHPSSYKCRQSQPSASSFVGTASVSRPPSPDWFVGH
jgi:hypothetical protein